MESTKTKLLGRCFYSKFLRCLALTFKNNFMVAAFILGFVALAVFLVEELRPLHIIPEIVCLFLLGCGFATLKDEGVNSWKTVLTWYALTILGGYPLVVFVTYPYCFHTYPDFIPYILIYFTGVPLLAAPFLSGFLVAKASRQIALKRVAVNVEGPEKRRRR